MPCEKNNLLPPSLRSPVSSLASCGLELEKLSDLSERLNDLLDLTLEVTKRTRGENENIYLNRRIEIDVNDGEPARDAKGDLIPF